MRRAATFAALAGAGVALVTACNYIIGLTQEPTLMDGASDVGDAGAADAPVTTDGSGTLLQLVDAFMGPYVLDDASVFYTEPIDDIVGQINKDGTGSVLLANGVAEAQMHPSFVAIDDTALFWSSSAGIHQCAKGGCAGKPTDLIDDNADGGPYYSPEEIAVDNTFVYFLDSVGSGNYAVRKVPKGVAGGPVTTVTAASKLCPYINSVRFFQGYMYFACDDGRIGRSSTQDGGVAFLSAANPPPSPDAISTDGTSVYYGQQTVLADLYDMPVQADASSTPVALGQPFITSTAVDSQHVYWTTLGVSMADGQGAVWRCNVGLACGGSSSAIAQGLNQAFEVTPDGNQVFFITTNGLYRAVNPP